MTARKRDITFAFDLDGTITACELLPAMAALAGLEKEISRLTRQTLSGEIPFAESFARRFSMLSHIDPDLLRQVAVNAPLDPHIEDFIQANAERCVVVTGNLDYWIEPIRGRLGCRFFSSVSCADGNSGPAGANRRRLVSILDKGEAVRELLKEGRLVVAIGESVSDIDMFRHADIGISFAGVHRPVDGLLPHSGYCAASGKELCGLLGRLIG